MKQKQLLAALVRVREALDELLILVRIAKEAKAFKSFKSFPDFYSHTVEQLA